ncbi:MAG: acetyl-CoA C-acetyltransferase [Saprospiraceae bacterium]|jgi:acetyl-CoA C-acetyltransferase
MRNLNRKVAIIGGARIPFTKSFGHYSRTSSAELLTAAVNALVKKYDLGGKKVDEVVLGTLIHSPVDWNWAREIVQSTALDPHTPVLFHARACGTSLDAANTIAMKITTGQIENGIAGGSDTNSDVPLSLNQELAWKFIELQQARSLGLRLKAILRINPLRLFKLQIPDVREPRTKMNMGEHTELTVKHWNILREHQDELSYQSHLLAETAYQDGFFSDLVFPFKEIQKDTLIRPNTTLGKLSKLKSAFDKSDTGTLTAGNSSAFTDGAASIYLTSEEYAHQNNIEIESYFVDAQNAALDYVNGQDLLLAPTVAVSELLKRNNLTLHDFDFYEIHEAFAGQVLATLKAWESDEFARDALGRDKALGGIDRTKLNTRGGSVAIGHPFAATGARILAGASKILKENGGGRCLVSVCTAGGMGTAAIIER